MAIVYSFDLGTTSIGWAVLQGSMMDGKPSSIIPTRITDSGVRIFPDARDQKNIPYNQERRNARMVRRQTRRRRERKKELRGYLTDQGLLPTYSPAKGGEWEQVMSRSNSWELRAKALHSSLSSYELGQVLYHIATRRQFRGRDDQVISMDEKELQKQEEKEESGTKTAEKRKNLLQAVAENNETLGSHLAKLSSYETKRNKYATRALVEDEFNRIIEAQEPHHSILKSIRGDLEDIIFAQKPVFWRFSTLGECEWCPESKKPAQKGSWLACQKRMLEKLNNLKIAEGNFPPLESDEKTLVINKLQTQNSITFGEIRKLLGLPKTIKFNLEVNGEKSIPGNLVEASLHKVFGEQWQDHPQKQVLRDNLHQYLFEVNYHEICKPGTDEIQRIVIRREQERIEERGKMITRLMAKHGLSEDQAKQLTEIKLPTGWEPFSEEALQIFLPELESGKVFSRLLNGPVFEEWRKEMFPNRKRPTGELHDQLPSPNQKKQGKEETRYLQNLRNPTLQRCLNELRKVTNNLIRQYGKPNLIRMEVTRDLALSKKAKADLEKAQTKQRNARNKAKEILEEKSIPANHDTIEKYLLAEECGWICPYSGASISHNDLFIENQFQVEHIYPRSRTLDDSFKNKTLCRSDLNREKGDRTPYEAFHHREEFYAQMIKRVKDMVGKKDGMHKEKLKRFLAEEIPDDFTNRHLTDTGYITRQARDYLKRLWPDQGIDSPVRVQTYSGKITGELRRLWGLNEILSGSDKKTRDDHRHHALDAIVIGCMTPGLENQLSRYHHKMDDIHARRPHFGPPWSDFRQSVEESLNQIIVSHKVRKKLSGAIHEGTYFGKTQKSEGDYHYYVVRKPVEGLTDGEINRIRDDRIREIIEEYIKNNGAGSLKKVEEIGYPRLPSQKDRHEPEIRKVRILEKAQPKTMMEAASSWVKTGNTHHISIYRLPNGKGVYEVVSLLEARKRLASKQPIVNKTHPEHGGELIMSLSKGDLVFFPEGEKDEHYFKFLTCSQEGQMFFAKHNDAKDRRSVSKMPSSLIEANAQKLSIDPIGRIRKAK